MRGAGAASTPRNQRFIGCMPATMKSVVGSSAGGITEPDGRRTWPCSSKKERNPSRSSAVVFTARS